MFILTPWCLVFRARVAGGDPIHLCLLKREVDCSQERLHDRDRVCNLEQEGDLSYDCDLFLCSVM